jgi:dipeptidyl aminopeptidase/acylaminoacyl peptidase
MLNAPGHCRRPFARTRKSLFTLALSSFLVLAGAPSAGLARQGGGDAVDRWTPELSMRYRGVQGTALSHDGTRVAYVVREALTEGEKSEYLSHIWVATADGKSVRQFTRGDRSTGSPSFSPDGRYLAFTASRSGRNQVWVLPLDGGEAEQVTEAESGVGSYSWSPDGKLLAYTMVDPPSEAERRAEREKRAVIIVDQDTRYSHLYVVPLERDATGKRVARRLTSGTFQVGSFDWSPDGRSLAFAHRPRTIQNDASLSGDISVVGVDGGAPRDLVAGLGVEGDPRFSPDGRTIAFISTGARPEPVGLRDVYLVPAAGGSPRKLAETPDRNASIVAWAADGKALYIMEAVRTTRQVLVLPMDGGAPRQLTTGPGVVGSVAVSGNGKVLSFTHETPETPADVYISQTARFKPTKLTDLHAGVPRPALGRTEVLAWTAKDGTPVEGLLTYPVGYRPGQRVPLILNVHGGPAGVFSESFTGAPSTYMLQTFAQEGYAILRPNTRGSVGYGKEFRFANVKDWGYGDFEDLMSGVDHVIGLGVAHPDSLLLMGWSYGGYMTAFGVTRTERFKAASMGAGITNLVSMVTTTDIRDLLAAHMGGEFWNDYATYMKHSATFNIEKVTTPTQVIHGAADIRVPTSQGEEFYRALDRRGIPTEMILLPRTPHGPREPKLLMEVTPRILTWFNRYLGRPAAAAAN